jgi:2'-5' RNA ligase
VRLFVAVEVPEGPREEARRRLGEVRGRLPPARWVDPDAIHLTLIFLGAIDEAALPALGAALGPTAAAHAPFAMALSGGGTFPPRRPARVAWIGVEAGPGLAALQAAVSAAASRAVGYEPESRPYNPHITLARCPESWPRPAIETWTAAFAGPVGEPFPVSRIALFESQPAGAAGAGGAGGRAARYRVIEAFPLAGHPGGTPA